MVDFAFIRAIFDLYPNFLQSQFLSDPGNIIAVQLGKFAVGQSVKTPIRKECDAADQLIGTIKSYIRSPDGTGCVFHYSRRRS
jgi:hypothetical protein